MEEIGDGRKIRRERERRKDMKRKKSCDSGQGEYSREKKRKIITGKGENYVKDDWMCEYEEDG